MKSTPKRLTTNKLWANLRRYDYRGAFEKIAFTAIGLWLALFINNWNDERKKHRDERQLLHEMYTALQQDSADVAVTCEGFEYRLAGCKAVLQQLKNSPTVTDSLRQQLPYIDGYSFLLANTGPYETLKARGFDLIRNDSIRRAVTTLYDVEYESVQQLERFYTQFYTDRLLPLVIGHFKRTPRGLEPLNWTALRTDHEFREVVQIANYHNGNFLADYQDLKEKINALLRQIEREF